MTQKQFNEEFKRKYKWEQLTLTDRRLLYNDVMQEAYNENLITAKQLYSWGHPKFLTANKSKINCNAY